MILLNKIIHSGGGGVPLVQALQKGLNPETHQIGKHLNVHGANPADCLISGNRGARLLRPLASLDRKLAIPSINAKAHMIERFQRASTTSEGSLEEASLIPTDRVFAPSVRVIRSAAKEINSKEVITESGESVPYAQLVLATGSLWNSALALPNSRVDAVEHLRAFRRKLDAAQNVLIIGGGSVGIGTQSSFQLF